MSILLMFGKYSSEAMKDISPDRTEKTREVIQKNGGIVFGIHELGCDPKRVPLFANRAGQHEPNAKVPDDFLHGVLFALIVTRGLNGQNGKPLKFGQAHAQFFCKSVGK